MKTVDDMIADTLLDLNETNPNLTKIVINKKPLVTSIAIEQVGIEEEPYSIIYPILDFTCKQEDHENDLKPHTVHLYYKFQEQTYEC